MKLVILDKDGTVVKYLGDRPANTPEEQVLLPGVSEKISWLKRQGYKIALASNQGGVAWGFISYAQASALMADAAEKVGADAYRFCPHDARALGTPNACPEYATTCGCRKPAPGMLLDLMREFNVSRSNTIYVGDRDEDRQAAQAAGVHFVWAQEFFK